MLALTKALATSGQVPPALPILPLVRHNALVASAISGRLKKLLNGLQLILIYLKIIQQDLPQLQKLVWAVYLKNLTGKGFTISI